ncbi:MAG: hypothetical protein D6798_05845, partial [Deltaproteobacteria bacterium]
MSGRRGSIGRLAIPPPDAAWIVEDTVRNPEQPPVHLVSGRRIRLGEDRNADGSVDAELQLGGGSWRPVRLEPLEWSRPLTPSEARRLLAAGRLLRRRCGDDVVALLDLGAIDGRLVRVTERWDGVALRAALWGVPLPLRVAAELVGRVAAIIAAAHDARPPIVHGRLTADAVVLGSDGRLRLRGFDLGGGGAGPADDVYAMGALLYELLAGQPLPPLPIQADACRARVRDLVTAVPFVPPAVIEILVQSLAFEPGDRPAAAAVARMLTEVARKAEGESLSAWIDGELARFEGDGMARAAIAEEPTADEATVDVPAARESTADEATVDEPAARESTADEATVEEPAVDVAEVLEALPVPDLEAPAAVLVEARAPRELVAAPDAWGAEPP